MHQGGDKGLKVIGYRNSESKEGNALEPGTVLPIHRHTQTNEVVVILRGIATRYFYDENGNVDEVVAIKAGCDCPSMSVEKGRWHRIESLESGTVIFDANDCRYREEGSEMNDECLRWIHFNFLLA